VELKTKDEYVLISVIITCYNHAHYLKQAIESVLNQDYPNIEILVIDDGSSDETKNVALEFRKVRYVYQENQGLSAARNTGIDKSTGSYLIFLDADDWFINNKAFSIQLRYLEKNEKAAFVSGDFLNVNEYKEFYKEVQKAAVTESHYGQLLYQNYIGMHATVMYCKWIFDEFRFDTSLRACEDYDIYLKIAGKYPVIDHTEMIAAYRKHTQNMSGNIPVMIEAALKVLNRQRPYLETSTERSFFSKGIEKWKDHYCNTLFRLLRKTPFLPVNRKKLTDLNVLFKYRKRLLARYFLLKIIK